jgi:hypothetical protein
MLPHVKWTYRVTRLPRHEIYQKSDQLDEFGRYGPPFLLLTIYGHVLLSPWRIREALVYF